MISWADFEKLDIRVGTIAAVDSFPKAIKPAYRLRIDFGEAGILNSSAQITNLYSEADLLGRQVIAVINFPPKKIADYTSECLVLGIYTQAGVVLLQPANAVNNGDKIG